VKTSCPLITQQSATSKIKDNLLDCRQQASLFSVLWQRNICIHDRPFCFASVFSAFLYWHPDSSLRDGGETHRQKCVKGFIEGRTSEIHSCISPIPCL